MLFRSKYRDYNRGIKGDGKKPPRLMPNVRQELQDKMNFEPKDVIRINFPWILGDPPVEMSFELSSDFLVLTVPFKRIYKTIKTEVISNEGDHVTLRCTNDSVVFLHSDFLKIQDIYWYPFIFSKFSINFLHIKGAKSPWLEITTPNRYKSITKLSTTNDGEKRFEKWTPYAGTYYFPLKNGPNSITMTFKANGASIYDGLVHLLLPILLVSLGMILSSAKLPDTIRSNTTAIVIAVLLTLTPLFLNNFRQFLEGSFMSLTLGLFLYLHSYIVSVLYIVILWFFPAQAFIIMTHVLFYILILFMNTLAYFRKGTFNRSEERRVGKECRSRWSPYH